MKKTSEAGPSGLDLPKATSGVSDQTRNAGTECLLQAFIATKQRNGEAPRSKDDDGRLAPFSDARADQLCH